jgi:spore coat protein A, manganese oxidase
LGNSMKISRREAIRIGLMGSGAILFPFEWAEPSLADCNSQIPPYPPPFSSQNPPFSPQIPVFQQSFRTPPILQPAHSDASTDYYEIVVKPDLVDILPGRKTPIWSYNGMTPGPTIRQKCGRQSVVRFINQLEGPTVTHLHGMASLPQYDGYPNDLIPPNHYKDYIYPNTWASTFWYHDHTIHHTARNVYAGLAGIYIVEDEFEKSLNLPKGNYDVPLIIQDKKFTDDGQLVFNDMGTRGSYGDVILVNGVPWPRMEVANRKYRFRVLNAGASRTYQLSLSTGDDLIAIGTDAGLRDKPVYTKTLRIAMAERYGFIIDFSKYPIGTKVVLQNWALPVNIDADARSQNVMCFKVTREEKDDSIIPETLRPFTPIEVNEKTPQRTFRFERNGGLWTVNNKTWDCDTVDYHPPFKPEEPIEIWNLVNPGGGWIHPVHIHLLDWQILSRNGKPPLPYERGWKDTFYVGENQTVKVVTKFDPDYACSGRYVMHCHNLPHEDHDMMTQFEVGQGGPSPLSEKAKPLPAPPFRDGLYSAQQGYCAKAGCRSNK